MSRVGKLPVEIPQGVEVAIANEHITIKGKLGELVMPLNNHVEVSLQDHVKEGQDEQDKKYIVIKPENDSKKARALWGTMRSNIYNMVQGVHAGFQRRLEINGVGYKSAVTNKILTLDLGYSHSIMYAIPEDIEIKCEKPTLLIISGASKQKVGQVAGEIKKFRPVEPYKGKGVYEEGAFIRRKENKKK